MTAPSSRQDSASRWLTAVVLSLAVLSIVPAAWQAALHCDEFVVLRHITNFADGIYRGSSRPGLLFLLLAPTSGAAHLRTN